MDDGVMFTLDTNSTKGKAQEQCFQFREVFWEVVSTLGPVRGVVGWDEWYGMTVGGEYEGFTMEKYNALQRARGTPELVRDWEGHLVKDVAETA